MLQDRLTYGQVYGISPERKGSGSCPLPRAFPAPTGGAARRRRGRISAAELAERNGEEPEEPYAGSRCQHKLFHPSAECTVVCSVCKWHKRPKARR